MRVLVVEDEPALALRLQKALEAADFAVDVAYDGEEGWHLGDVGSSRVDLQACKLEYSIVSPK